METKQEEKKDLSSIFSNLFSSSMSGSGEEEMLRIASKFSRQITARQIKLLLYLEHRAITLDENLKLKIRLFISRWLELKEYNNSASFVMRALESVSLRKFINENSMKVNVQK